MQIMSKRWYRVSIDFLNNNLLGGVRYICCMSDWNNKDNQITMLCDDDSSTVKDESIKMA
jgi:hypothetical protein